MDIAELGLELIRVLMREYPEILEARYGLEIAPASVSDGAGLTENHLTDRTTDEYMDENTDEALTIMEEIARRRGFILPGKRIDYERTARTVLDEFRRGKIGRITLEWPGDN